MSSAAQAPAQQPQTERQALANAIYRSLKRTHELFLFDTPIVPQAPDTCEKLRLRVKERDQYGALLSMIGKDKVAGGTTQTQALTLGRSFALAAITHQAPASSQSQPGPGGAAGRPDGTVTGSIGGQPQSGVPGGSGGVGASAASGAGSQLVPGGSDTLVPRKAFVGARPTWHAPWMLYRVISGPAGWVRCVAVEPNNEWFATGSAESVIKIWDLATGRLKLTLTGHVSAVRGIVVSARHPYLFSCAEDKTVKCWDLETNRVVRHYHGHLSAVYSIDLHPTVDCLVTAGRDSTVRVWDVRTKANVHTFSGHTNTVSTVRTQTVEPQIISASHDSTVRLWDLIAARCRAVLTNHKKSVRALAFHPTQFAFASASPDNIKQWRLPDGEFLQNVTGHNAVVNGLAVNADGVMVSAADNGSLCFFDWRSAYNFQKLDAVAQPGSIESETGIFAITFDRSGSRLITGEADKTIKMYREDETATEESHPLNWKPSIVKRARY